MEQTTAQQTNTSRRTKKVPRTSTRRSNAQLNAKQIEKAARAAFRALEKNDLTNCCLFGSMACYLYGMKNRVPHDIDILISDTNSLNPEEIKQLLVSTDPDFFLVASTNPEATYKVLWYRISEKQKCKVDILVPGTATTLELPWVPHDRIVHVVPGSLPPPEVVKTTSSTTDEDTLEFDSEPQDNNKRSQFPTHPTPSTLPALPLIALLLLKLQGWHDHRHSRETRKQGKVREDKKDVEEMLDLVVFEYDVHLLDYEEGWIPRSFLERTEGYVREYVKKWGASREGWEYLGLL